MNKPDLNLQKHTLNLFKGDYDRLKELYNETGAALIVRKLVRAHLKKVESKVNEREPAHV